MSKAKTKIKVMLVEDHVLIRMGLATVSQLEPDIELVAQVDAGEEAVACFRKCRPDVVIMDMRLPGEMDGIQTITALREEFGTITVLVLSNHARDDDVVNEAAASGHMARRFLAADAGAYVS